MIALFAVLMNILFLFYDRIITVFTKLYETKIENKIKKYFK